MTMMEVPDLALSDPGDHGSVPPSSPTKVDPPPLIYPPRSTSPPPSPRRNTHGLPPTYLVHLRALLRQWLEQQTHSRDSLSNSPSQGTSRLWDAHRAKQIEQAIWTGAILPSDADDKPRLLDMDWPAWAASSAKRKQLWKQTNLAQHPLFQRRLSKDPAPLRNFNNAESSRGRLSLTPAMNTPALNTPIQRTSRSSSVNSSRDRTADGSLVLANDEGASKEESDPEDPEEAKRAFCHVLSGLPGFRHLSKREEWEFLDGDHVPPLDPIDRDFPGAFPQMSQFYSHTPPPMPPSSKAGPPRPTAIIPADHIVKPVFCAYFPKSEAPPPPKNPLASSTGSLRHRRQSSVGGESRWWPTADTLRRKSNNSVRSNSLSDSVVVEFVEGEYALPSYGAIVASPKSGHRRSNSRRQLDSALESNSTSINSSGEDSDNSSDWSGTQRAVSTTTKLPAESKFISGDFDDLPCQFVDEARLSVVGGTLVIRGLRKEEREAVHRTLQLVLFTIQAMVLELELRDAFRAPREEDSISIPRQPARQRQSTLPIGSRSRSPALALHRGQSVKERGERAREFLSRIGKDTRGIFGGWMDRMRSPESPASDLPSIDLSPPATVRRSFDFRPVTHAAASPPATQENTVPVSQATERCLHALSRLEQLIPSTTPGLRFPLPPLLLRVRIEDQARREAAKKEVADESGYFSGLGRHGGGASTPREDGTVLRARNHRMGGDVRAGLGALINEMDTFSGWQKLQRLETLVATGLEDPDDSSQVTICQRPSPAMFVFWGNGDETIQELVGSFKNDEEHVCPRPGCEADDDHHVRWWYHNDRKVTMSVHKLLEHDVKQHGNDVWVKCSTCAKASNPRQLSEAAESFSWGKLLELLLYTSDLQPKDFCVHASTSPTALVHYIRTPSVVVSLAIRLISVLDTRLPKLQVGSNVPKRRGGKTAATLAVDSLLSKEAAISKFAQTKADIKAVFKELNLRADNLRAIALDTPHQVAVKANGEGETTLLDPANALNLVSSDLDDAEEKLLCALDECPIGQLNDVRENLVDSRPPFVERLDEWQRKLGVTTVEEQPSLPTYFKSQEHVLPGSSIVVREDDPSSIIAYTLSSIAYFGELTHTGKNREEEPKAVKDTNGNRWIIEVRRRHAPRDLLPLRTIPNKKSDASFQRPRGLPLTVAPDQPSTELSLEPVEAQSQTSNRLGDLVKTISKATARDPVLKARSSSMSESDSAAPSATPRRYPAHLQRQTSDTVKSAPPSAFKTQRSASTIMAVPPSLSRQTSPTQLTPKETSPPSTSLPEEARDNWSSTLSSSINSLLTFGSSRVRNADRSLASLIGPLSMMSSMDTSLSSSSIDDRPHIQLTYTLPDKLKIECMVYYATAFDSLRRRCAIDKSILESLSRCDLWNAQGGKSKASFFMTSDKKYIVKELVSKWNMSDIQALLEISPSYFEHLAGTHNKATALAKILGFFSVKIQNLQDSTKKTMDLMVMENIFYNQNISKTYDLKGIEGRKVPKTMPDGTTLFDGDWIEGQSRTPILLHPHAKRILQEAISCDTRYLCQHSIMDYSLLLGLDKEKEEIVVGIVDAIGSYNLFKTIESRSKTALSRGADVTIVPPDQYRERFENALKHYFVACPDKWSKPAIRQPQNKIFPSVM